MGKTRSPWASPAEPQWTWDHSLPFSWVEAAGEHLLIADTSGAVLLLDGATGRPLWETPVALTPGARPADRWLDEPGAAATRPATPEAPLYFCDSFSISAVDRDGGRLLWRMGEWPSLGQRQRVDPEVLPRILAAHATPNGVLALRDDGAMGLLNAADGSLRWRRELGPASQAELHVRGGCAWLLWRGDGRARATRLPLDSPPEEERPRIDLGEVLPIWSRVIADGSLLLVWTDRIAALSAGLEMRDFKDAPEAAIQQRGIELALPAAVPILLVADVARGVHAYDVLTGRALWRSRPSDVPERTPWTALAADATRAAAIAPDALAVYAASDGKQEYAGAGGAVAPGGLFFHDRALHIVEPASNEAGDARARRFDSLSPPGDSPSPTEPGAESAGSLRLRRLCFDTACEGDCAQSGALAVSTAALRRVMLVGERLIVESASHLAAFRLPPCGAAHGREKPASPPSAASGGQDAGR